MIRIHLEKELFTAEGQNRLLIDLDIQPGEFIAIGGPSGVGKTTLLRMLAGLTPPDHGEILFGRETWLNTSRRINLPPQKRKIGLVFQDYALFPNMTVRENLAYGLDKGQPALIIDELVQTMELEALVNRYPTTLSGGQQQRVALARALVRRPSLLLLDEPLSALDAPMRSRLQRFILNLHRRFELTTILVSHDHRETSRMADRILTLESGRLSALQEIAGMTLVQPQEGAWHLRGEVLGVEEETGRITLNVLIGTNLIRIPLHPAPAQPFQPGDPIWLTMKDLRPQLVLPEEKSQPPES